MLLKISAQDLQKNKNLDPGWYKAKFKGIEVKPSALKPGRPPSTNFIATFIIEKDERELSYQWNSQMMQMAEKFFTVVGGCDVKVDPNDPKKVLGDVEFDPETKIGQGFQVHVFDEPYQGRMISKIDDFAPYDADMTAPY